MHVAAAAGAPTVGIFPFQSDFPERWAPLGLRTEVVRASYPCHPGDTKERCSDYACIAHLDVERIVAATQALIGGPRARHDTTVHL
jgi:ADP-heptose:LPS heptosyltransferase